MAHYVIGDVQGCFQSLVALTAHIEFDPNRDQITLAGDLIGRGPQSLQVMEWVLEHTDSVDAVLGNHDLHFLAVAAGLKPIKPKDRTETLLQSPKRDRFVDWFRHCPLSIDLPEHRALVVHAGVWPGWDRTTWMAGMQTIQDRLLSTNWAHHLSEMYGNEPAHPDDAHTEADSARFLINAATRMRFVDRHSLALEFSHKETPDSAPDPLVPWMDSERRVALDRQVIFGHWAMLRGQRQDTRVCALDTGCVYGDRLTALRLDDRALLSVEAVDDHG